MAAVEPVQQQYERAVPALHHWIVIVRRRIQFQPLQPLVQLAGLRIQQGGADRLEQLPVVQAGVSLLRLVFEETPLWVLTHPDIRKAARVRAFATFAARQLRGQLALLEGTTS